MRNVFNWIIQNNKFKIVVKGGPAKHEYKFLQFHMHWGDELDMGSEHLINGHPFAAEVL